MAARFSQAQFGKQYNQTIGIDFFLKRIVLPGKYFGLLMHIGLCPREVFVWPNKKGGFYIGWMSRAGGYVRSLINKHQIKLPLLTSTCIDTNR